MTQATVTADIHQSLDIHLDTFSEITLYIAFSIENRAELIQLVFAEVLNSQINVNARLAEDLGRARFTYTIDVGHSDLCPLIGR